jgi:hypothetical protein
MRFCNKGLSILQCNKAFSSLEDKLKHYYFSLESLQLLNFGIKFWFFKSIYLNWPAFRAGLELNGLYVTHKCVDNVYVLEENVNIINNNADNYLEVNRDKNKFTNIALNQTQQNSSNINNIRQNIDVSVPGCNSMWSCSYAPVFEAI